MIYALIGIVVALAVLVFVLYQQRRAFDEVLAEKDEELELMRQRLRNATRVKLGGIIDRVRRA